MSAPSQGGLFQGKKFWLSQKVPGRSKFIQQIEANGGIVVLSNKDADICLVDHLKDDNDDSKFSYQYVEKSLREGRLVDLKKYQVVPKYKQKIAPSGKPQSSKRNYFTKEEDDILIKAVHQPGVKRSGNVVYQMLADKYPQHTMHGWRGRWVDHFSKMKLDMPEGNPEEIDEGQLRVKREREQFTEEDEIAIEEFISQILKYPDDMWVFERLSDKHPRYTPKKWHTYFNKVILPKIKENGPKKPDPKRPTSKFGRHDSDEEQPGASSNRDKASSKSGHEVKIKPEPTSSSPVLKHRRNQPPATTKSPIFTVGLRKHPRSTSQERKKPPTPRQPHSSAPSSPTYRPGSPTPRVNTHASSKKSQPATPPPAMKSLKPSGHVPRWRAEVHKTPTTEDKESPPSSPPKVLPLPFPKRKRDMSGFTPEQRKKSRNIYKGVNEVASTPEPESPVRSRVISPELQGSDAHHHTESPPPPSKIKKQRYAEMSTQALYDQVDDDPSFAEDMEFPEIPSTSPAQSPPSLQPKLRRGSNPSTKLPVSTSAAASTEDDPDGIKEMEAFLAYCHEEYKLSEKQVIYAIERTSGIKPLVKTVLQTIADGKPLPTHVPGVWSEEEDKILMGSDSREVKKLADKKGSAHMERRMDFLNLWNMA